MTVAGHDQSGTLHSVDHTIEVDSTIFLNTVIACTIHNTSAGMDDQKEGLER